MREITTQTIHMSTNHKLTRYTFLKQLVGIAVIVFCSMQSYGQMDKRLTLADQYFANGDYFTAAQLYEQFLNPLDKKKVVGGFPINPKRNVQGGTGNTISKTAILFKQAESYRLSHYMLEASSRYKQCFEADPQQFAAAYYWHAVCQRSLGFYNTANESLQEFLSKYATGSPLKDAAKKEAATLAFISAQLQRPDTILYKVSKTPTSFGAEKGVFAPVVVNESQYIVTSTQIDSMTKAGKNPYRNRLFMATAGTTGLTDIEPITIEGLNADLNQGAASLSADGNFLYFTQWQRVNGVTAASIFVSKKQNNSWSQPALVASINATGSSSKQPFCTSDGKFIFFSSDRTGGSGGFDIWYAPLQPDGTAGDPVNAGTAINTRNDEQAPFYHTASQTLVFSSNGRIGMGGYDLFSAKGWGTEWTIAQNMGYPVNSTRDDIYYYAPEQAPVLKYGMLSSDRGSNCCLENYSVEKMPKKRVLSGRVLDLQTNLPLANAEVTVTDATGQTYRTITGDNGTYAFELSGSGTEGKATVRKELYKDSTTVINVTGTNEADPLIDVLSNTDIFLKKKLVIKPEEIVILYFDFDKSIIKPRGVEQLDSIYEVMVADPTAAIQISGYTDGLGTVEYNIALGDRRARACADYLIGKGIAPARISFESFGECCPAEMEILNGMDNPDGRSKNRRALINITKETKE